LDELHQARLTDDGLRNLCKKDFISAFENVPLGDNVYGLLGCTPSEMLHVSGTGLLKYMFECLGMLISLTRSTKRDRETFDDLHRCMVRDAQRQSERDFPRMSIRNGVTNGTKMCGSERVGNCFVLLCVMHTQLGQSLLAKEMGARRISLQKTTYYAVNNSMDDTIKYYATEYMNGEKRYDFAMINFVSDEGMTATCPAKILGFVRYNITKGIPTPQFSGDEELSLHTIRENDTVDNNVYVVVHTASDYVSMEQLQSDFITSFTLGNITECVYIVNIDSIRGPLFVFKNYGSVGEDTNKLFCSIPQEKWGQYFSDRIY
jgi:hypothetical protein